MKLQFIPFDVALTFTYNLRLKKGPTPISGITSNLKQFLKLPEHVFFKFKKL